MSIIKCQLSSFSSDFRQKRLRSRSAYAWDCSTYACRCSGYAWGNSGYVCRCTIYVCRRPDYAWGCSGYVCRYIGYACKCSGYGCSYYAYVWECSNYTWEIRMKNAVLAYKWKKRGDINASSPPPKAFLRLDIP
jgi:hypothetical protein